MIVGRLFEGDDADSVAWSQNDVYGQALGIIRSGCASEVATAARILDLEAPEWTQATEGIDHRTLQTAHDVLAAAWRFRADAGQGRLPLTVPQDLATEWLAWLRAEVRSWRERPTLIHLVGMIITNQNTTSGYAAEDRLVVALMGRFDEVPWTPDQLRLKEKLEDGLTEGKQEKRGRTLAGSKSAAYDTGCGDYPGLDERPRSCDCLLIDAETAMRINQMTTPQFERMFPNEDACAAYLVAHRWPDGVHCPRCGSVKVYALTTMAFKWECMDCGVSTSYRFSHIAGTIFENTNKPLREWFRVIRMMMTSKKGVSALQVQRVMGFGSYETAWSMCHRIRAGLVDEEFQKLMGIVEMDETYVGGSSSNRHVGKRGKRPGNRDKDIVIGAVERKGNVVARVVQKVTTATIRTFVAEAVSNRVSMLCTDQLPAYGPLHSDFFLRTVDHSANQYFVGAVHTQTIDGFWSLLKRGVMGTFHKVSAKYLPLYVAEFQFRYNNRENPDIFGAAVSAC